VSTDPAPPKPASQAAASTDPASPKPASQAEVSTDPALPKPDRAPTASACEPYRQIILHAAQLGRNAMAIWQDLVDDYGFGAKYSSVRRFLRTLDQGSVQKERVVIVTAPGEEGQVDYGQGPMVLEPQTGKYRRTRLFVLTLGYSRKSVRLLTFRSSARIWAELHEEAFRRLGGTVRVIVLDNLREGVLVPDIYDPTLNPLYRDVLRHYGVAALPCRVRDPDRKGKVESAVGHAQKTPLKGLRFETLEEAQAYLDRWEARWADTRIHGTTKRQVLAMFAEEQPHLLPLPAQPFHYYQHGVRTVHLDGCVEVEAAYYHAPPGFIGKKVLVQWDGIVVRLLDEKTGQLLREYIRQRRGRRAVRTEDLPKHTPKSTHKLLCAAGFAGKHIGALCDALYRRESEAGLRRIQAVLGLCRQYGTPAVEDACGVLLTAGIADYRPVRQYLERQSPRPPLSLLQVDPLIRELTHYRDLIARRVEQAEPKDSVCNPESGAYTADKGIQK
jgi:transposase